MVWLAWFAWWCYCVPVVPVWCFLWVGSRPRRGRFRSWLVASVGATFWLPMLALAYAGHIATTTREQRAGYRRQARQMRTVERIEAELREAGTTG